MTGSIIASETSFLGPYHADESSEDETAVHGCHCPGDMAVRMRKVLAIPRKNREVGSVCLSAEIDNKIIRIKEHFYCVMKYVIRSLVQVDRPFCA